MVRVTLFDNSTWDARLVGHHPDKDLAVLKIDVPASRLKKMAIGTSADLKVGQKVFAIGNPFGLDQTLTTGVISGLGREIQSVTRRPIQDVIQTDAAINPGNSGGPLLDSAGRLIGVNTAIYSPSGVFAGIGLAVPVDTVNQIVPQLIRTGKVDRPGLGVTIFADSLVDQLLAGGMLNRKGVLVLDVIENGAAAKAGIRPTRKRRDGQFIRGDLILAIDEDRIQQQEDLFKSLENRRIGGTVIVTVLRDGRESKITLKLQPLPTMNQ